MSAGRRLLLLVATAGPLVSTACLDIVEDRPCIGSACLPEAGSGGSIATDPPVPPLPVGCSCGAVATPSQKGGRACACAGKGVDVAAYCHEVARLAELGGAVGADPLAQMEVNDVASSPQGTLALVRFDYECPEGRCWALSLWVGPEGREPRVHQLATCFQDGKTCIKDPHLAVQSSDGETRFAVTAGFAGSLRIPSLECAVGADCDGTDVCVDGRCVRPSCADGQQNGDETGVDCGGATCGPCDDLVNTGGGNDGFVVIGTLAGPEQVTYDAPPWCITGLNLDSPGAVAFAPGGSAVVAGSAKKQTCVVPCGTKTNCNTAAAVPYAGLASATCAVSVIESNDCATGFNFNSTQDRALFAHRFPPAGKAPVCALFLGGEGFNQSGRKLTDVAHGVAVGPDGAVWLAGDRSRTYTPEESGGSGDVGGFGGAGQGGAGGFGGAGEGGAGGEDYRATRGLAGLLVRYLPGELAAGEAKATCLEIDEAGDVGVDQILRGVGVVDDEVLVAGETLDRGVFDAVDGHVDLLPDSVDTDATEEDVFILGVQRSSFGSTSPIRWVRSFGGGDTDRAFGFAVTSDGDHPRAVLVGRAGAAAFAAPGISIASDGSSALVVELVRDPVCLDWNLRWLAQRGAEGGNPSSFLAAGFQGERLLLGGITKGRLEPAQPPDPRAPSVDVDQPGMSQVAFLLELDPGATESLEGFTCTLEGGGAGGGKPGVGGAASCDE